MNGTVKNKQPKQCSGFLKLDTVEKADQKGLETLPCPDCLLPIDVATLLYGRPTRQVREQTQVKAYRQQQMLPDKVIYGQQAMMAKMLEIEQRIGEEGDKTRKHLSDQLEGLCKGLENLSGELTDQPENGHAPEKRKAEGVSLRQLRVLLDKLDPSQTWGNLRDKFTPEGEVLWLCPYHYDSYDPVKTLGRGTYPG